MVRACHLVFSSFSYLHVLDSANKVFDTVVVDDAQSISELLCLVPLRFGCRRLLVAGDLEFSYNPFTSVYGKETLAPFNIVGRVKGMSKSVHSLDNVYRRDRPIMFTMYSLEGSSEIPTPEKELSIIKQDIIGEMEGNDIIVVGFLWKYTDAWKHMQPEAFTVMNIDELFGVESDIIIIPMWTLLHCYDPQRVDMQKTLNSVSLAVSRAKQEVVIVGDREKVRGISKEWDAIVGEAKVRVKE